MLFFDLHEFAKYYIRPRDTLTCKLDTLFKELVYKYKYTRSVFGIISK